MAYKSKQSHSVVPDTSREVPDGDRYYCDLLKLFPSLKVLALMHARKDARLQEVQYSLIEGKPIGVLPPIVNELLEFIRKRAEVVGEKECKITVGCYMRVSGMKIAAPHRNTSNRILMNFGYDETFKFDPRVEQVDSLIKEMIEEKTKIKMDSGLPEREHFIGKNHFLELGSITSSNYTILVPYKSIDKKPDSYGKAGIVKGGTKMRVSQYQRVTVIIDFISSSEVVDDISNKAREVAKHIDVDKVMKAIEQKKIDDRIENEKKLQPTEEREVEEAMKRMKKKMEEEKY